jgi:hypothetical protein
VFLFRIDRLVLRQHGVHFLLGDRFGACIDLRSGRPGRRRRTAHQLLHERLEFRDPRLQFLDAVPIRECIAGTGRQGSGYGQTE